MHVAVTCKLKKDRINSKRKKWRHRFFRRSRATNCDVVGSGRNSNSSKLLRMSSLPARMKKIRSKLKALDWPKHFSHCKCIFQVAQRQLTPLSVVGSGRISKSSRDFMVFFVTCRNEKDPIKIEGARVTTTLRIVAQLVANLVVSGGL